MLIISCNCIFRVVVDNYTGSTKAEEHLYKQSTRDVWVFTSRHKSSLLNYRDKAVEDYAKQNGYPKPTLVYVSLADAAYNHIVAEDQAIRKKLIKPSPPYGLVVNGDYLAYRLPTTRELFGN